MSRKKTTDEIRMEIASYSKNIIMIGEYTGNHDKTHFKCLSDGYEWDTAPISVINSLKNGKLACPRCSGKERYTHQQICEKVKAISPNINILSEYKGICAPLFVQCDIDGYKWKTTASNLIHSKYGCPKCHRVAKKTTDEFVEELYAITQTFFTIGEYNGGKQNILCHCCICGTEWFAKPTHLLHGSGCPKCASSKGEKRIREYLIHNGIKYIPQKSFEDLKDKGKLYYDFYLPDKNTCIEFDGRQHFSPVSFGGKKDTPAEKRFETTKRHDELKNQYCVNNNINLIRIPYTDFDNIESILDKHFS